MGGPPPLSSFLAMPKFSLRYLCHAGGSAESFVYGERIDVKSSVSRKHKQGSHSQNRIISILCLFKRKLNITVQWSIEYHRVLPSWAIG